MDSGERNDPLGDRMKRYENITRAYVPRRTYTLVRVDGRAFHTFTQGMEEPFDAGFTAAINAVGRSLCRQVAGAQLAFCQSDEISLLLTDFQTIQTEPFFGGNIQKICSITAAIATASFLWHYPDSLNAPSPPVFDSRVWTIPDPTEVENYFIWRQQDATRNSIQSLAQAHFSQRELHGKSNNEAQDMLMTQRGINWNDVDAGWKRGRVTRRVESEVIGRDGPAMISRWETEAPPVFTQERQYLSNLIPRYE